MQNENQIDSVTNVNVENEAVYVEVVEQTSFQTHVHTVEVYI